MNDIVTVELPEAITVRGETYDLIEFSVPKTDLALEIFDALAQDRQDLVIEAIAKAVSLCRESDGHRHSMSEVLDDIPMPVVMRLRDAALEAVMNGPEPEKTPSGTYILHLSRPINLNEEKSITAIEFQQPTFGRLREALRINDLRERFYAVVRLTGIAMIEGGEPEPMVDAYTRALSAPDVGSIIGSVIADFFG